jgi:hypothetical protein
MNKYGISSLLMLQVSDNQLSLVSVLNFRKAIATVTITSTIITTHFITPSICKPFTTKIPTIEAKNNPKQRVRCFKGLCKTKACRMH